MSIFLSKLYGDRGMSKNQNSLNLYGEFFILTENYANTTKIFVPSHLNEQYFGRVSFCLPSL